MQIIGLQCSRFKYGKLNDITNVDQIVQKNENKNEKDIAQLEKETIDNLQTTFYCAYPATKPNSEDGANIGTATTALGKSGKIPFFVSGRNVAYDPKATQGGTLSLQLSFSDPPVASESYLLTHVAHLRAYHDHYLGREIFFNTGPSKEHAQLKSPEDLIGDLLQKQGPRLYIVAGNQIIVGDQSLGSADELPAATSNIATGKKNLIQWRPSRKIIDKRHTRLGSLRSDYENTPWERKGSISKNSPSIVNLLIASTREKKEDKPGWKLIHYSVSLFRSPQTARDNRYRQEMRCGMWKPGWLSGLSRRNQHCQIGSHS